MVAQNVLTRICSSSTFTKKTKNGSKERKKSTTLHVDNTFAYDTQTKQQFFDNFHVIYFLFPNVWTPCGGNKTQLSTPLSLGFHQRQSEAFQKAPDTGFD